MADRLPEALVGRFAVAIRDVLWYRDRVYRFFDRAGVPASIMAAVREMKDEPTIKKCLHVIDLLEQSGPEGIKIIQTLFSQISDWNDLSHLSADKQTTARQSQDALKAEIRSYANRVEYQQQLEQAQHKEREEHGRPRQLDHARLQAFRNRFDTTWMVNDPQRRGNELEALLNDVFDYYCPESRGPFRRQGEQVDGHFRYDGHDYFCEIRWRESQANAADISVLRDRAVAGFGGDVRALFVSFNGFTSECLESLNRRAGQERVILMDGVDLRGVLNSDLAFDILLREKLAYAVRDQRAFVSAREIVLARIERQIDR
jgi:hypothetical protein